LALLHLFFTPFSAWVLANEAMPNDSQVIFLPSNSGAVQQAEEVKEARAATPEAPSLTVQTGREPTRPGESS